MEQATLFDDPAWLRGEDVRDLELDFWDFHKANPDVYRWFSRFVLEAIGSGRKKLGARMIWERMRWHLIVEAKRSSEFKLNDHLAPFYARLFMRDNSRCVGFFETRERGKR